MNLVNDEALQEIKQQLSEIKISTSKKDKNFGFSSSPALILLIIKNQKVSNMTS